MMHFPQAIFKILLFMLHFGDYMTPVFIHKIKTPCFKKEMESCDRETFFYYCYMVGNPCLTTVVHWRQGVV